MTERGRSVQDTANMVKHKASALHEICHKCLSFKKALGKIKNYYCEVLALMGLPALMPHLCTNDKILHPCVVHIA